MPKADDQPESKRALVAAAVAEIADKGWGGLRTRAVSERAGVNKALVHYHFGSIDNLRIAAVTAAMRDTVDDSAAVLLSAATLAEGIRQIGGHLDAFRPDDPRSVVLMEAMVHVPRDARLEELLLGALTEYEQVLAARIRREIDEGRLGAGTDVAALTTALTALVDGMGLHAYMRPGTDMMPAAELVASLLETGRTHTER